MLRRPAPEGRKRRIQRRLFYRTTGWVSPGGSRSPWFSSRRPRIQCGMVTRWVPSVSSLRRGSSRDDPSRTRNIGIQMSRSARISSIAILTVKAVLRHPRVPFHTGFAVAVDENHGLRLPARAHPTSRLYRKSLLCSRRLRPLRAGSEHSSFRNDSARNGREPNGRYHLATRDCSSHFGSTFPVVPLAVRVPESSSKAPSSSSIDATVLPDRPRLYLILYLMRIRSGRWHGFMVEIFRRGSLPPWNSSRF